jgi:hypothetical protein
VGTFLAGGRAKKHRARTWCWPLGKGAGEKKKKKKKKQKKKTTPKKNTHKHKPGRFFFFFSLVWSSMHHTLAVDQHTSTGAL